MQARRYPSLSGKIRRRLLADGSWLLLGKVANAAALLLANALLARLLAPDAVGTYFLCFSAVTVFARLSSLGLELAAIRLLAECRGRGTGGERTGIVHRIAVLAAVSSTAGAILAAVLCPVALESAAIDGSQLWAVGALVGLWTMMNTARLIITGLFHGGGHFGFAAMFDGIVSNVILTAGFAILFAFLDGRASLTTALGVTVAATAASMGLAAYAVRRTLLTESDPPKPVSAAHILTVSLPMMVAALLPMVAAQSTLWIVGTFGGTREVALYGVAFRLFQSLGLTFVIGNLAGGPTVAELYSLGDRRHVGQVARALATLAMLPSAGAALLLILFGRELMSLVFGSFYADATFIVVTLSLGRVLQVALGPSPMLLTMTGHERLLALVQSAGSLALIAAAIVGYWWANIDGVAVGVACVFVAQAALMAGLVRWRLRFWPVATLDPRPILDLVSRRLDRRRRKALKNKEAVS